MKSDIFWWKSPLMRRIQGGIFLCIQESKEEKADPFLLCACLSHLGLALQMCAESEGAKSRLRRRE